VSGRREAGAAADMEHPLDGWLRIYLEVGRDYARREPNLFPSLVALVRLVASSDKRGESELRALVERATGRLLPPPLVQTIGDLLVWADPTLSDVRDLDEQIAGFTDDERRAAADWARARYAAAGDEAEEPTMPGCVAGLYRTLEMTPCAE